MSILHKLGLGAPHAIDAVDDLRSGRVRASGRLVCPSPLTSPVTGTSCAGYLYVATHLGWRTMGPSSRRVLHRVQVFAEPMMLHFDTGGEVELISARPGEWSPEAHARLAERDMPGFRATETLLPTGRPVFVLGTARLLAERWQIRFEQIVRPPATDNDKPEAAR